MNYEMAKEAQKIAEEISVELYGSKAMAELCLPAAYEQIRQQALAELDKEAR